MRKLLTLALAANALLAIGCASSQKVAIDRDGTRSTLLAKKGEVHDALMAIISRDPQYEVVDAGDVVTARFLKGNQPWTLTAYLEPGSSGDETDVEIVCQGPNDGAEKRRTEREWLGKLPEAVKYLALDHVPDLRTPLDEGPRATEAPAVPSIDRARRYRREVTQ